MEPSLRDLEAPRILNALNGTRFRHVEVHPSLPSTQSLLVAEGGRDGRVIVADHQTAGRGRVGRSWLDVPGKMLMFSALVRDLSAAQVPLATLAAGVAVARAVEEVARAETTLKWPNDVRVEGRKLCGILGELASDGNFIVLGMGLNVGHDVGDLPQELETTSLLISCGQAPRRDELCAAILWQLDPLLGRDDWLDEYRSRCETIGREVRVDLGDTKLEGTAESVNEEGALVVDGRSIVAGDVFHVR